MFGQELHNALNSFFNGLPPIHYDASGGGPTEAPQINTDIFAAHTIILLNHVQLYDSAGLEPEVFGQLHERRLVMAKRIALLVRAFLATGIPLGRLPITCLVSSGFVFMWWTLPILKLLLAVQLVPYRSSFCADNMEIGGHDRNWDWS